MPKTRSTRRRNSSKSRGGRKRQAKRARKSAPQQRQPVPTNPVSNTRGLAQPPRNRAARILANIDGSKGEQKAWSRFLRAESPAIRRDARKFLKRMAWLRDHEEQKAKAPKRDSASLVWISAIKRWNKLASRTLGSQIAQLTVKGCDITVQLIPVSSSSRRSRLAQAMADEKRTWRELVNLCARAASFAASRSGVRSFELRIYGATLPPEVFADCDPITQHSQESSPKTTIYSEASVQSSSPSSDATPRLLCPPKTEGVTRREEDEPAFAHVVSQSHA